MNTCSQFMEEEVIDADSHMLTPRADSLMRDEHGENFRLQRHMAARVGLYQGCQPLLLLLGSNCHIPTNTF